MAVQDDQGITWRMLEMEKPADINMKIPQPVIRGRGELFHYEKRKQCYMLFSKETDFYQ